MTINFPKSNIYLLYFYLLLAYFGLIIPINSMSSFESNIPASLNSTCSISIDSLISASCFGGEDGKLCFRVGGDDLFYNIEVIFTNTANSFNLITEDSLICIPNLSSGPFSIEITSSSPSCTESGMIEQPDSPLNFSNLLITDVSCEGGLNGSINLDFTGGTSPYTYGWDNDSIDLPLVNVENGAYTISVEDANGCTDEFVFEVNEPDEITGNLQMVDVTCFEGTNGVASVFDVEGGNGDYSFLWSTNESGQSIENLAAGIYMLTITDSVGCTGVLTDALGEPDEIEVTESVEEVHCFGESNGRISLDPDGGTGDFTYSWSNGEDISGIENLSVGSYTYIILDENNCVVNNTITIGQPDLLEVHAIVVNHVSCGLVSDGQAIIMATGGTGTPHAEWDDGTESETVTNLEEGVYFVTITDNNECVAIDSVLIEQEENPIIETYDDKATIVDGESTNLHYEANQPSVFFHWAVIGSSNIATNANDYEGDGIAENEIQAVFQLESNRAPGWILLEVFPRKDDCIGEFVQTRVDIYPVGDALFIPEFFTPNGDGANDNWEILFPTESTTNNYAVKIFNRSGGMIYERNGMAEQWNAEGCPDGVYYYVISSTKNDEMYKGAVTIMRK